MRWFRTNSKPAWLALFALVVQLSLSFGHVHLSVSQPALKSAQSVIGDIDPTAASPADDSDDCLVCLTIYLTGTSINPIGPILLVPVRSVWIEPALLSDVPVTPPPYRSFDARAPPLTSL